MAINTVGYIANRAIEVAQLDSGFLPLARQYLNLSLNMAATDFDWPYLRVQAPDAQFTGTSSYALPTDYNRSDTCYLVDENNNSRPITIISKYRFDKLVNGIMSSDPTIAYINLTEKKIYFNATPSSSRKYRLTYFRTPEEYDESGGDDSVEIDFENSQAIMYSVIAMLMDYQDDERAALFQKKADDMQSSDKMNCYDEDNDPRIELGPSFRAGSRPTRGGGSSWGF